ncbi:tRNA dimethylallyltransferase [Acaryochloris thomasi RCC1774]|uniref:tRNA dimethylallyltransferase n=1 Tax=Acaryochloris thomasi RCC1774 TaxID=1764569 RepID=A0A2W1JPH4_9CYAN|nr:tRNA (adenosine(37)-N6)-dimethylallyltransferase MiaA [Acaryochloris thomasi]PZD75199.1 tRNA dimethylallyltransferase [Acaryochloris thomasi RCC1774]
MIQPGLIVICGPTATGKSRLALHLAERLGGPILSADSRQVYREFDIGTAKPSREEQSQVPHHLIDICDPTETFTLAQFQQQAQELIAQYQAQGIIPLLVGGTGLYIKAVVQGLKIPQVGPQLELRSQLPDQTQSYGWLQQVDPSSAAKIHPNDRVRTLRALEVYYVTGLPLSQQQGRCPPTYPILQIGLDDQDLELHTQRIQQRTQVMIEQGWLTEIRNLMEQYGPKLPLLNTLGYQEMRQHLQHEISLEQAQDLTVIHTRQFAKRQRTWFRADPTITWLAASNPDWLVLEQVIDRFIRPL